MSSQTTVKARIGRKKPVAEPPVEKVTTDEVAAREIADLKRRLKRYAEGELDAEKVIRRIEGAIRDGGSNYVPAKYVPLSTKSKAHGAQELVLLFSDTHASEVVSLEETRGINEYNWDIMLQRMDQIRTSVLSHQEHFGFEISKLNVFMLGDMLSGDIHEELAITNDRPTTEAIVQLAYDTAAWLTSFTEFVPKIKVAGVIGNHPRASKKPAAKLAHNNGDWLYYKMVEALLKDKDRYEFSFPRGSYAVEMLADRYRALLMHGDGIRSSMPGVPWGGVVRRVTQLEAQFSHSREPLDYIFMGHWHSAQALGGIQTKTWINGSVKGADEYGLKSFGMGHSASQTLLTVHPKYGWTGQYGIQLQDSRPASEGWPKK